MKPALFLLIALVVAGGVVAVPADASIAKRLYTNFYDINCTHPMNAEQGRHHANWPTPPVVERQR